MRHRTRYTHARLTVAHPRTKSPQVRRAPTHARYSHAATYQPSDDHELLSDSSYIRSREDSTLSTCTKATKHRSLLQYGSRARRANSRCQITRQRATDLRQCAPLVSSPSVRGSGHPCWHGFVAPTAARSAIYAPEYERSPTAQRRSNVTLGPCPRAREWLPTKGSELEVVIRRAYRLR